MSSAEKLMVPSAAIRLGNRLLRRPVKSCAGQIGSGSSVPLYTYVRVRELITPSATHNVVSISSSYFSYFCQTDHSLPISPLPPCSTFRNETPTYVEVCEMVLYFWTARRWQAATMILFAFLNVFALSENI